MENKKIMWHGYLHISGSIQVKPIICEIECNSPFVRKYIPPFEVRYEEGNIRDQALKKARDYIRKEFENDLNLLLKNQKINI